MYKRIIRNKNFMTLQIANAVNRLGDSLDAIALSWLVYQISQSASSSAINFAINYLPTVILQPLMGAYVAKLNKQKVMVISDFIRGCVVAFLALNVVNGTVNTVMIYTCTFMLSLVETLRLPASNAIIPFIINSNDYSVSLSLSGTVNRVCELIGAAVGGIIVSFVGVSMAILIDAASFFISGLCIALMKVNESISDSVQNASFKQNFKKGIHYVLNSKFILILTLMASFANLMLVPLNALQSAFISIYYHGNAIFLSLMSICVTVGSLIGGLIYPLIKGKLSNKLLCLSIFAVCGFYYIALVASGLLVQPLIYIGVGLSSIICGLVVAAASCHLSVLMMENTDANYLSRVGALNNAMGTAFMPLGSFIIAIIAKYVNVVTLFTSFGIMTLVISILAYFSHQLELLNE